MWLLYQQSFHWYCKLSKYNFIAYGLKPSIKNNNLYWINIHSTSLHNRKWPKDNEVALLGHCSDKNSKVNMGFVYGWIEVPVLGISWVYNIEITIQSSAIGLNWLSHSLQLTHLLYFFETHRIEEIRPLLFSRCRVTVSWSWCELPAGSRIAELCIRHIGLVSSTSITPYIVQLATFPCSLKKIMNTPWLHTLVASLSNHEYNFAWICITFPWTPHVLQVYDRLFSKSWPYAKPLYFIHLWNITYWHIITY